MARRFLVPNLAVGIVHLDERQSIHLRDVLRLSAEETVELFDPAGQTAPARILCTSPIVELQVDAIAPVTEVGTSLAVAAAVPKGSRADWMVEKLSELGVDSFVPLESSRSVVHPETGKLQRWKRIAEESAKQCRRAGVMEVTEPIGVSELVATSADHRFCLSTAPDAIALTARPLVARSLAAIGPEGGWTDDELRLMAQAGFQMTRLTRTILRVETAAIAVASIIMTATNRKET